ncbi:hypothetical protein GCM10023354_03040 [Garicola koreensis]
MISADGRRDLPSPEPDPPDLLPPDPPDRGLSLLPDPEPKMPPEKGFELPNP